MERVMGIEPTPSAWEAEVLPLNYTRWMTSDYADPTPQADWHKENPSAKADCWQDLRDLERTGNRDRQNHSGMR